jgi:outer membrane protein OmpA-like peptidoglycan-associated protein
MAAMASATVPVRASNPAEATHSHNDAVAQQAAPPAAGAAGGGQVLPRSFMVYFEGGSAKLDGADQAVLSDVARLYKSHGGTLRVVGHASSGTHEKDAYKSQIVNLRVSTQRAEAVAAELARLGVPRSKMAIAGVSDSQPLYQETTRGGIAGNRRVEIFFGP